jgi:hypothetical protein
LVGVECAEGRRAAGSARGGAAAAVGVRRVRWSGVPGWRVVGSELGKREGLAA